MLPMRFFSVYFIAASIFIAVGWETDFEKAKEKAAREHKFILLNFSGSDWCIPCINLKRTIFENTSFQSFADSNLVLISADFPRLKKNQLAKDLQKSNEKLADKYNPDGIFPYTLLLNAEGKLLKSWEGLPDFTAEQFILLLKETTDARK